MLTAEWAEKLTEMGRGKHHLGDFLPPEELEKFMETYSVRNLRSLTELYYSNYSKHCLTCGETPLTHV